MKSLLLLRHAKTVPYVSDQPDFTRALTVRGHRDAQAMGRWLSTAPVSVDTILSSTAIRARETTEQINEHVGLQDSTVWIDELYGADTQTVLTIVRSTPDSHEQILLIGHNPGLENLLSGLCCGTSAELHISLPTAGLAMVDLAIETWDELTMGIGELRWYIRPSLIR